MKKIVESISNLIRVKTVVTFVIVAVFAALALNGTLPSEFVKDITLLVISFYFGTQAEKKTYTDDVCKH